MNARTFFLRPLAVLFLLAVSRVCYSQAPQPDLPRLIVFHSPSCHRCVQAKHDLMPAIEKEFKGRIVVEYRDITEIENYRYMLMLLEKYRTNVKPIVPLFYLEGRFLNGQGNFERKLRSFISHSLSMPYREGETPRIELIDFFRRFNFLGITLAGLEDGINPCAFTVIVFFISYLAFQGYKRRELIIIGLTFISTVFVSYLLIGLGIFNFLYALRGFWIVTRITNIVIGAFSITLGIFALYDFFKFRQSKDTEAMVLQLPRAVKNQIHSVIGLHYRRPADKPREAKMWRLFSSAIITGFLVTLLEAVCTGQLYLPTITFILKTSHLKLQALGYLIYYNILFVVPLFVIFVLALSGVTSSQFANFLKRHLGIIKLFMAILFFVLGFVLIYSQVPRGLAESRDTSTSSSLISAGAPVGEVEARDSFIWDFGRVKEGDVLRHIFILKNETQKVLNIKEVNTSCGCTISRIEKKILKPDESTHIDVRFNSKGYSGKVQQYIYVHTDNLDNPILRLIIKAEVIR